MITLNDAELYDALEDCLTNLEHWDAIKCRLQERAQFEENVYLKTDLQKKLIECTQMIDALCNEIDTLTIEYRDRGYNV